MARSFHRKKRLDAISEINVTPLIDLAFSLLIIFMITAPLLEQSIALNLPIESTKAQSASDELEWQVISIDDHGNYFWGQNRATEAELSNHLSLLAMQSKPPVIHVRAEASIPYQKVITVLDLIKVHQLSQISLDTQPQ